MSAEPAAVPLVWMLIAPVVVGLLAGFALMLSGARARRAESALEQARRDQQTAADRAIRAEAQGESHRAQVAELREALRRSDERADLHQREQAERYDAQQQQLAAVQADRRALRTQLDAEREQSHEKLSLLIEAREQLSHQFKALASEILDEKSRKFTEQNQLNLGQLLNPLQERLKAFQTKVEEVYVNESKDRSALVEQVKNLTQLNNALSQDTQNLTQALKGDRKAQGDWGEIILDDVLEKAGLMRGQHYVKQGGVSNAEGQGTSIPDVVIRLPGERFLVVDSKLTLPDYRAFAAADEEGERSAALRRHLAAIRAHIKGLSEKKYQTLYDLKSLDFVVMFVPLEPAFTMAVTHDSELFQHAWEKNVLLVSPSTLLFVVRTVANLWRQEDLSRNAKDISAQGAKLYEKLVGFVTDLDDVGKRIQQANESFGEARRKLRDGNGNLIGQAEKLRKLGIKPSKALPSSWVESAADGALDLAPPENEIPSQPK